MANVRIKDITTTASVPNDDDYLAIDGATSGTRKVLAKDLQTETDTTLSISGKAADAKVVGDDITNLKSAIGDNIYYEQDALDTTQQVWTSGKYISKTSGNPIALDGYSYTDITLDSNVTKVTGYTSAAPNSNIGVSFVDATGTFISGDASTNTGRYDYNYDLDVPENAAKFRVSCRTNYTSSFTCSLTKQYKGLEKRVDALEESVNGIRDDVNSIIAFDNTILTVSKNIFNVGFNKALLSNGIYISRTDAGHASTLDYTEVTPDTAYTVSWEPLSAYNDNGCSLSVHFYSSEDEAGYISRVVEYHVFSLHYKTFITPQNCNYVRFYMYNSSASDWDTDTKPQKFQLELGSEATLYVEHEAFNTDRIDSEEIYNNLVSAGKIYGFVVPDYYFENDYLPQKISRINQLASASAGTGETFVFMTDEHWAYNAQKSPALLNYIYDRTHIKKLFSGGDLANGGQDTTWDSASHTFRDAWGGKIYRAIGNHEYISATNTDNNIYYWFSADNTNQISGNPVRGYYYVDNPQQKIRYIVLNAFSVGNGTTANAGYEEEQRTWVQNTALNVENGWTIIIVTHVLYRAGPVYSDGVITDTDFVADSSNNGNALIEILDSYNGNGEIAFVIQGHSHYDKITSTPNGIPVVLTTCDKTLPNEPNDSPRQNRVLGTISEQAFDVVVVDTRNKSATFVRIGQQALNGVGTNPGSYVEERTITWGT